MEKKAKKARGFYVEKGSFFAHAAVTILVLSIVARLLGTLNLWSGDLTQLLVHVALPVGSALLFILFILLLGRVALWTTILPILGGAAFFILSIFDSGFGWPLFICIALAFLAAFLYTATLTGMIRSKWLIVFVFALIFAYQIVFRAMPVFRDTQNPVSFVDGMLLLSSLGMVFAMFCASLALRRRKKVKTEQPAETASPDPAKPEEPAVAEAPSGEPEKESGMSVDEILSAEAERRTPDPASDAPAAETAAEEIASAAIEESSRE